MKGCLAPLSPRGPVIDTHLLLHMGTSNPEMKQQVQIMDVRTESEIKESDQPSQRKKI